MSEFNSDEEVLLVKEEGEEKMYINLMKMKVNLLMISTYTQNPRFRTSRKYIMYVYY